MPVAFLGQFGPLSETLQVFGRKQRTPFCLKFADVLDGLDCLSQRSYREDRGLIKLTYITTTLQTNSLAILSFALCAQCTVETVKYNKLQQSTGIHSKTLILPSGSTGIK